MIYVNGDSWTSGWPDEETYGHQNFSWPHLLSLKINETVINDARAGCSNDRIYRRTFDYLLLNKPKLAIVCLTQWVRFELGDSASGKIYQYQPSKDNVIYKNHWQPYLAYSNFLRQIISLQNIATATNTQLLILDTFNNNLKQAVTYDWFVSILKEGMVFDHMDDQRINQKFNTVVELNNLINYNMFISDKSYQSLINGCNLIKGHPVKDGHERIADIIYHAIKHKG